MTEAEVIQRFEAFGLLVEPISPTRSQHGYFVIDPIREPDGSIEGPGIPFRQMTCIWREGNA